MNTFRDASYDHGVIGVSWDERDGVSAPNPDGTGGYESGFVEMEDVDSMWVYYDVVTEDGEVHRYLVYLERGDI